MMFHTLQKLTFQILMECFHLLSPFYKNSNVIIPDKIIIDTLCNVFRSTWAAKINKIELPCGEVPIGCCYNDFKRSNVRLYDGQLVIIDWEFMTINGLPGIDLITYYVDVELYKDRIRNAKSLIQSERFDKIWRDYLLTLGILIDSKVYLKVVLLEKAKWLDSVGERLHAKKYRNLC